MSDIPFDSNFKADHILYKNMPLILNSFGDIHLKRISTACIMFSLCSIFTLPLICVSTFQVMNI